VAEEEIRSTRSPEITLPLVGAYGEHRFAIVLSKAGPSLLRQLAYWPQPPLH